ncbi:HNH/endonuclease VII fold putative polymorphic toxin, partial [Streptomyces sp. ActVer]|uniref:HNH/endonuclease VII fold putative polymorphic toxin n=1 Tax=Streptomyces sp. ActVer TaxID=3014558 RepID=UPI0022B4CFC0
REDAAGDAKRKLDEASDAGIQNRKWYEEVGDWVSDNWDTIVAVSKVVVAVLGVIALIIGGPILGAIVLIAALVVLADTLNKYAKGQASLWDVAFAALDCIPGMKGLTTIGGLAKGLKGLKGLKAGMKGMATGARGLGKSARGALADGTKGAYNRLKSKIKGCGDPVDAATGQMFMAETDVALPGVLPVTFTRRAASGYRTGWWFGPTWSSTVDQRLEVDEGGIVFVTEDGMLLAYPHPETSNAPVLPEAGPRWPLVRLDTGGYRIDDTIARRSHYFAPPDGQLALLERISDRNGNTIDFDHDADGAPRAIRHSGGYHLALTVEEGRVTALSLADAAKGGSEIAIKQYGYTGGNLTSVTNSSGCPMRFTYDERLRITSWADTNNSNYVYTYDDQDRCLTQEGEAGHVANSFAYDGTDQAWPGHRVTTVTTPEGATSRFVINDNCQVVVEVDPLGGMVRTAYDAHHHLVSTTDELGHTTRLVNNALGQATEVIYPDGAVIRHAFNDLNLPVSMELPDGSRWLQQYDEAGNCTAVTDPSRATTRYVYTEQGHLAAINDALGHTTTVRCNPAGLPLENINPLGAVTVWERDAFGRPVTRVDPLGHATWFSWTIEGLPSRRTTPDGSVESWTYDGEGNCTSHTDQVGRVSRFEYTHFDLLSARTDPDGSRHEFGYDSSLRLTGVVNPQGMSWLYTYDAAGNLTSETDFDDRTIDYTCDAAGRYVSRTNALGQTVRFERDALGRVVRKDADGRITTYAYGAADQLSEVNGPDATLTRRYNPAGRLDAETVNGRNMTYLYDELGRRIRRTTPSGAVSTWEFDAADNQTRLTASGRTIAFTHDATGRELTRRTGEFATMTSAFDELGRITTHSVSTAVAPEIQRRSYRYGQDGNLVRLDDKLNGTRRYDLDAVGRVTAVEAHDWSERYAYDEAGNQSAASWPAVHPGQDSVGPRRYRGTRIEQAGNTRYEHDTLGRITLRQKTRLSRKPDTWRYEWDAEDQLAAVVTPDGTRWRYQYDPLGRRIGKQRLGADAETVVERVDFTWDGSTLCEQTTVAPALPDPVIVTWDYDGLHPISQTERMTAADATQDEVDSRFFAIVTDLIGTPTELIDESGTIAWRARTTLWGTTAWASSSTTYTPLRFPGQYHDAETGLHYNYFRYYDPETARYLTSDPLGLEPDPNPLTYVDNPHRWTDPLGLAPTACTDMPSHKTAPSRNAAFRMAKRDLGIPMTQQPDELRRVPMTDRTGRQIMDDSGKPVMTREYVYTREDGSQVIVQDHSAGHDFREGGVGNQGRHYNVRPSENPRTGKVPGTAQHYEY